MILALSRRPCYPTSADPSSLPQERDPGSVKSLLALLRLSQDEAPAVAPHKPRPNAGSVTRPTSSPQAFSAAPSPPRPAPSPIARPQRPGPDPTDFQPEVPSQRNLQELIETLRKQNEEYQRPHPTSKNSGDVPLSPSPSRSLQGSSPSTEQVPQVRRLSITKTSVALPPNAAASTLQASPQHAGSSLQHGSPASRGASAGDANVITGSQRIHLRQSTVSPTKRRKVDNDEGFQRKDAPLKSALKRPTVAPTHTSEASSSLQSSRAGAGASTATHSAPNRRSRPRSLKPLDPSVSPEFRSMPFSKALPIVSGLIGDDAFLGELRKVRACATDFALWIQTDEPTYFSSRVLR